VKVFHCLALDTVDVKVETFVCLLNVIMLDAMLEFTSDTEAQLLLNDNQDQTPAERQVAMTWAQHLKRVLNIDIETCSECGGAVKIIACIEDPVVIQKILDHLQEKAALAGLDLLPQCRAPPQLV